MRQSTIHYIAVPLLGLWLTACATSSQGPTTWIDRPLDGDQVALESLTIQAHASDADGVSRFEFFVGEAPLATLPVDGGRFTEGKAGWSPTAPGTYVVVARAVDTQGNYGPPATARIVVGALAAATPTPVPAAIGTGTPTPVPAAIITITPTPVAAACPGPPVITSFTANPTTITYGQTIVFSWGAIMNADDAVIDAIGHIGLNNLNGGSFPLMPPPVAATYPTKTTTFTLTATGCGGKATKQVTVVVNPTPTPPPPAPVCPGPPVIASFTASPSTITVGQSATLSWGAVTNATSASIAPGIGGIPAPGSTTVSPAQTTTYTLTATGCGGTVTKQVTLVVNPPTATPTLQFVITRIIIDIIPPTISNMSASPNSIAQSGCPGQTKTTVSATVTDDISGVDRVVARLYGMGGGEVPMGSVGGNVYRADVGPFGQTGQLIIRIVAWDRAGNLAMSNDISVNVACIR